MKFALGVDGGATKTMACVGDETGRVMGVGLAGPSNYQLTGIEYAMSSISSAVNQALEMGGLPPEKLHHAVFALAGADFPVDFETFTRAIKKAYPGLDFRIVNDVWAAFRAGTPESMGGVVICGTGSNFGAVGPDGRQVTGRGMGYEWGTRGGAGDIIRDAIHYAFRSHDGTGPKTALEATVLNLLGFPSYDALSLFMYEHKAELGAIYVKAAAIVPAVFQLASEGDAISQKILMDSGTVMGEIIGGMMERLGMRSVSVDVVTAGSIFVKAQNPLMSDYFKAAVHRFIPFAAFRLPDIEPAGGAFLMALEDMGVRADGDVRDKAIETFPSIEAPEMSL
ncbi:MAG TPA: hypothetical protein GX510_01385 [Firmicutes bacterium]|nr:hypothetical protein [Candidatus Fermentithermobacillaceae bacterium]